MNDKLQILEQLQSIQDQNQRDHNPYEEFETSKEMLDSLAQYIVQRNKQTMEQSVLKTKNTKMNAIKSSILDKKILEFDNEVIDFSFIPIYLPRRTNLDLNAIVFAFYDKDENASELLFTDMRGNTLINHKIQNCTVQLLLPSVHAFDPFVGILCSDNLDFHLLSFSFEDHPDVHKPSPQSPSLRIINEKHINIPEKLIEFANFNSTITFPIKIDHASSHLVKDNKYFVFVTESQDVSQ